MILLKMVLLFQPSAFIHENVQRFPADFLHTVLSSLYHVEHYLMDSCSADIAASSSNASVLDLQIVVKTDHVQELGDRL